MIKKVLLLLFLFVTSYGFAQDNSNAKSQIYYGENNFGKLEIVNDSICMINFAHISGAPEMHSCSYKRKSDTIFLYTIKNNLKIEINECDKVEWKGFPIIIRSYSKLKNEYVFSGERAFIYDTLHDMITIKDFYIDKEDIIVIQFLLGYKRIIYEGNKTRCFSIHNLINFGYPSNYMYFDDFPLLIKGNRLIPIDKDKNFQCWIENGFYFPIMKKGKANKKYKTFEYWSLGLRGLPNGFEIK